MPASLPSQVATETVFGDIHMNFHLRRRSTLTCLGLALAMAAPLSAIAGSVDEEASLSAASIAQAAEAGADFEAMDDDEALGNGNGNGNNGAAAKATQINEKEPNNTRANAQDIAIGANGVQVKGTLTVGGLDFFKVTVAPGKTLTARLQPTKAANFGLSILNANGNLITRSAKNKNGAVEQVKVTNKGKAKATVLVRANSAGVAAKANKTQAYRLAISQK